MSAFDNECFCYFSFLLLRKREVLLRKIKHVFSLTEKTFISTPGFEVSWSFISSFHPLVSRKQFLLLVSLRGLQCLILSVGPCTYSLQCIFTCTLYFQNIKCTFDDSIFQIVLCASATGITPVVWIVIVFNFLVEVRQKKAVSNSPLSA